MAILDLYTQIFSELYEEIDTINLLDDADYQVLNQLIPSEKNKLKTLLQSFEDELNTRLQNIDNRMVIIDRMIVILNSRLSVYTETLTDLKELNSISSNINSSNLRASLNIVNLELETVLSDQREIQYRYYKMQLVKDDLILEKQNIETALANINKIIQILGVPSS